MIMYRINIIITEIMYIIIISSCRQIILLCTARKCIHYKVHETELFSITLYWIRKVYTAHIDWYRYVQYVNAFASTVISISYNYKLGL